MRVLLNWLAQGTALTILVALGVRVHRTTNAATRERIWWIGLGVVALLPIADLLMEASGVTRAPAISAVLVATPVRAVATASDDWATWILCIWVVLATLSLSRVAVALDRLRRAKAAAFPFPVDREGRLRAWTAVRESGRRTALVLSTSVRRAGVLGLGRPVIAVAPGIIDRLSDAELDQIVVHEYAHIQRRDDIAILVQRIICALAGFHPAIRWLDHAVTIDREVACDDWVVTCTGDATSYAACLVKLASSVGQSRWSVSPGATLSRSQLAVRVTRLLDRRHASPVCSTRSSRLALSFVAGLGLICAVTPIVGRDTRESGPALVFRPSSEQGFQVIFTAPSGGTIRRTAASRTQRAHGPHRSAIGTAKKTAEPLFMADRNRVDAVQDLLPATVLAPFIPSVNQQPHQAASGEVERRESSWHGAASVGLAIGNGSRDVALKAAGFFARVGKSFGGTF